MILNFKCNDTQKIWNGYFVKGFPKEVQLVGRRKLRMIAAASNINILRVPPANRLKKLKGNKEDFYSIRINDQWRICFKWNNGNAYEVEIIDYH